MNAYSLGVKLACAELNEMEKKAFLGALLRGGMAVGRAAAPILREGFMAAARPVGQALEQGVGKGLMAAARSPLGKDMLIGGTINGGLNAMSADPGNRLSAFGKGFGYGALGGAATRGVASGVKAMSQTAPVQQWLGQKATTGLGRMGKGLARFGLNHENMSAMALTSALPSGSSPSPQPMTNIPGYY